MAYFFYSDKTPGSVSILTNWDKVKSSSSTESYEEYLVTNRFCVAPELGDITDVISRSLMYGYKANVSCLYYENDLPITAEKMLKYDGLSTQGIRVPILKKQVLDIFRQYCPDKIQIVDVVIKLKDDTELHDYKALNVINRVEAFTWEGSKKGRRYDEEFAEEEKLIAKERPWIPEPTRTNYIKGRRARFEKYGCPNISSMDMIAYKKEIVEKEIICLDSVTERGDIMICEALGNELKKHKFKGLRLEHNEAGRVRFV